jgi:hypothetical protein
MVLLLLVISIAVLESILHADKNNQCKHGRVLSGRQPVLQTTHELVTQGLTPSLDLKRPQDLMNLKQSQDLRKLMQALQNHVPTCVETPVEVKQAGLPSSELIAGDAGYNRVRGRT